MNKIRRIGQLSWGDDMPEDTDAPDPNPNDCE